MTSPNIEERLSAAAFQILTDDRPHSTDATRWAAWFMHNAALCRPTAFQKLIPSAAIVEDRDGGMRLVPITVADFYARAAR